MVNTEPNAANRFFFVALIVRDVETGWCIHSFLPYPPQTHRSSASGPTPLCCPTPTASPALTSSLHPPYPSLALQLFWDGVLRRRLFVEVDSGNTARREDGQGCLLRWGVGHLRISNKHKSNSKGRAYWFDCVRQHKHATINLYWSYYLQINQHVQTAHDLQQLTYYLNTQYSHINVTIW
jgi:hypothetical protein